MVNERLLKRFAGAFLAVGLTFGGVAVAPPAVAQPAAVVSVVDASASLAAPGPVDTVQRHRRGTAGSACDQLNRLVRRFRNFPFVRNIIQGLLAAFGCVSPG